MLRYKSNLSRLVTRIDGQPEQVGKAAARAVFRLANHTDEQVRKNLGVQGRGGQGPTLSPITRRIYDAAGEPDGSGIENHLVREFQRRGNVYTGTFGIPKGEPTMIAKAQDRGAVIPVTEKMRGFLAVHGIYLKRSTSHIFIPPRHFWKLAIRSSRKAVQREMRVLYRVLKNGR